MPLPSAIEAKQGQRENSNPAMTARPKPSLPFSSSLSIELSPSVHAGVVGVHPVLLRSNLPLEIVEITFGKVAERVIFVS
mmetsp:Transcript_60901/g.101134  ORF Transcript_60901/g.101134 Transcript_60901/m.101134 type:complete len:80 (-) Transcript_60901:972-1211(-)